MDNKLKTLIRIELSELDQRLTAFVKNHNLTDDAGTDLHSFVNARISMILKLIYPSIPFGSIKKLDDLNTKD